MPPEVAKIFASYGLLGAIVLVLGWACYKLYVNSRETEKGRLEDSKAVGATLLHVNAEQIKANASTVKLLEQHGQLLDKILDRLEAMDRDNNARSRR